MVRVKTHYKQKINLQGQEITVRAMCKCEEKEYEAEQEAFKKQQRELQTKTNKQNGLIVKEWKHCTFANDDGQTPKLIVLKRYLDNGKKSNLKRVDIFWHWMEKIRCDASYRTLRKVNF